jgi:hypothetical protein
MLMRSLSSSSVLESEEHSSCAQVRNYLLVSVRTTGIPSEPALSAAQSTYMEDAGLGALAAPRR